MGGGAATGCATSGLSLSLFYHDGLPALCLPGATLRVPAAALARVSRHAPAQQAGLAPSSSTCCTPCALAAAERRAPRLRAPRAPQHALVAATAAAVAPQAMRHHPEPDLHIVRQVQLRGNSISICSRSPASSPSRDTHRAPPLAAASAARRVPRPPPPRTAQRTPASVAELTAGLRAPSPVTPVLHCTRGPAPSSSPCSISCLTSRTRCSSIAAAQQAPHPVAARAPHHWLPQLQQHDSADPPVCPT